MARQAGLSFDSQPPFAKQDSRHEKRSPHHEYAQPMRAQCDSVAAEAFRRRENACIICCGKPSSSGSTHDESA
jgi:hypothetical protein